MANFTRRAIKEAFTSLLEERPLNDITVKDIVERCGINRNSFYYHYQDLPALIEEIIKEEIGQVFAKVLECAGVYKCTEEGRNHLKKFLTEVQNG